MQAPSRIHKLSNEVLTRIFIWLDEGDTKAFRLTCRRFRDTAIDPHNFATFLLRCYGPRWAIEFGIPRFRNLVTPQVLSRLFARGAVLSRYFVQRLMLKQVK